jgi:hypothetical protein
MNRREERSSRSSGGIGTEHHKTQEKTMKTTYNSKDAHEPQEKNLRKPERIIPSEHRENEEQWARRHGPEDVAERTEPPPPGGQGLGKEADHLHDRLDIPGDRIELTIDRMDRRICRLEKERGS